MKCIIASSSLGHQMCIDHRRGCVWSSNSSDFGVERHSSLVCKLGTETGKGTKSIELEELLVVIVSALRRRVESFSWRIWTRCINVISDTKLYFFTMSCIVLFLKHYHLMKLRTKLYIRIIKKPSSVHFFHFEPNFISFWWQPKSETLPCCAIHESLMLNCTSKGLGSQGILGRQVGAWVQGFEF